MGGGGNPLTFGVKNQIGYAIDSIHVKGAYFEADYVTDNDDETWTSWHSVLEIYEEKEVEVYMTEISIHPEGVLEAIHMEDGVTI